MDVTDQADPMSTPAARPSTPSPNPLIEGLWWGAVGGILELSTRQFLWWIRPRVSVEDIRTNHHVLWMIPASNTMVLGTLGLLLLLASRVFPRLIFKYAIWVFTSLSFLGAMQGVDHLHTMAHVALACGLAAMLSRAIAARLAPYSRLVRVSIAPLMILLVAWSAFQVNRVSKAEIRSLAALPEVDRKRPNVLLLVMDNVRSDDLSLFGYERDTTPNLKRLAARAARFDQARSTAPWTLPSHASMLTGRWPHELSTTVDTPLNATHTTLAEALAVEGYATAGFVANTYYCNSWYGLDRGFSRYEDFRANTEISLIETIRSGSLGQFVVDKLRLGLKEWPGDEKTRKSASRINADFLRWHDANAGKRPFFAFLNYYDAHAPFRPPAGSPRRFGLSALPEPERAQILRKYEALAHHKSGSPSADPKTDAEVVHKAATLLRDSYDDCIAQLDARIGDLFDDLERRGVLDDTLIILTSDHGEEFNEKSMFGHGLSVYRPEVHVPLLVFAPKTMRSGTEGQIIDEPATLRDIPATIFHLIGLRDKSPFPGETLARYWSTEEVVTGPIFSEVEHQTKFEPTPSIPASIAAIRANAEGRYVYIRNTSGREEVYDRESDPTESRNLAAIAGNEALVARLREEFQRHDSTSRAASKLATRPDAKRTIR